MTKRKKQRYETVHDENLLAAKLQGAAALLIFLFYTVRGVFMGDTLADGFKRSWLSSFGIVLLLFVLIIAMLFFLDWLWYACIRRIVLSKGTMHRGILAAETEKRYTKRGLYWQYTVRIEDGSLYRSTAYTQRILTRKCMVCVLGSRCIITSFEPW